jgi:hypothetical protein
MSHEEIIATAICFIDRDQDITGGNILFKRAFYRGEASYIFSKTDQIRSEAVDDIIHQGLQPLGQVETIEGRLLVFPNSHVHKITKLVNTNEDGNSKAKEKRRIIVLFIRLPSS